MSTYYAPSVTQQEKIEVLQKAYTFVYRSQAVLLSLTAFIIFLWLLEYIPPGYALILALLFGSNPYMVILTGLLNYSILHTFFTVLSCYLLHKNLRRSNNPVPAMILSGVLWGITTLIRPMTLILPVFVLIMLYFQRNRHGIWKLKSLTVFVIGMMIVIGPYAIRNYTLTNRFIPVNAQAGVALWANTELKLKRTPDHYRWWSIWYSRAMPIYAEVTQSEAFSNQSYAENVLKLEDRFKKRLLQNLVKQPDVWLYNAAQNFITFNLDIGTIFIKSFQAIQNPYVEFNKLWLYPENPQTFHGPSAALRFKILTYILTLQGLLGVVAGLIKKDQALTVPGLVYLCFAAAHSIVYMDLFYYYIKIPFLIIFFGLFLKQTQNCRPIIQLGRIHVPAPPVLVFMLGVLCLPLSFEVL